jgi:hypothetical protein
MNISEFKNVTEKPNRSTEKPNKTTEPVKPPNGGPVAGDNLFAKIIFVLIFLSICSIIFIKREDIKEKLQEITKKKPAEKRPPMQGYQYQRQVPMQYARQISKIEKKFDKFKQN